MDSLHFSCLQANLNHSAAAQDLFLQAVAEWNIGVAVAAEPYSVPNQPCWVKDCGGSVAIHSGTGAPLSIKERGFGFVSALWGEYAIVGVYFSPNRSLAEYEAYLGVLGPVVRRLAPSPVILLGDLNAKSRAWGAVVTDPRGEATEEWLLESGLVVLNKGAVLTCVRQNGGSINSRYFLCDPGCRISC